MQKIDYICSICGSNVYFIAMVYILFDLHKKCPDSVVGVFKDKDTMDLYFLENMVLPYFKKENEEYNYYFLPYLEERGFDRVLSQLDSIYLVDIDLIYDFFAKETGDPRGRVDRGPLWIYKEYFYII